ncbi:MAG: hypothetical protein ACI9NQ_002069 [Paracoccaceae bacterium]|jgi:hypothetical protein
MEYRVSGYRDTPANPIDQLNEARGWHYDRNQANPNEPNKQTIGGLPALDGRMGELKKVTVTIPEGEHAAGEDIWTRWGPSGFGHGITGEKDVAPEHEVAPEAFNGWPLFGGGNAGHVPMAGPDDDTPLEVGIDLTSLLKGLDPNKDGKGRLFIQLSRADGSNASGKLHECAIRRYDSKGKFVRETPLKIKDGKFGKSELKMDAAISDLVSE